MPATDKEGCDVNEPNHMFFIPLLLLVVFLGMGIMVAYGVWLLDLP